MKRYAKAEATMELLRDAAALVVRRDGPHALTRRALAAELGVSDATVRRALRADASLASLAAGACARRRSRLATAWHDGRTREDWLLDLLLPGDDQVDTEVVWLRLLLAHADRPALPGEDLRSRYQVATRGWSDPPEGDPSGAPDAAGAAATDPDRDQLAPYVADRTAETRALVERLVGDRTELAAPLAALVDGLVLAVCTGRWSPVQARAVLVAHLETLGLRTTAG